MPASTPEHSGPSRPAVEEQPPQRWYQFPDDIGLYPYPPVSNYEYGPSDHDPNIWWQIRMLTPEEVRQRESEEAGLVNPVPTALYRLHNKAGDLLYVGISGDPLRRWPEHAADKEWWPEVSRFSIDWFDNRPAALAAERDAIRAEKPLHNVVHNKATQAVA